MATQFGGKAYKNGESLSLGSSLKHWVRAFFPTSTTLDTFLGETTSIDGNMVGEYTIALSWIPNADWKIRAYFEHNFEDQSQMTFE